MFNTLEPVMNHVPRSYLTPADRDAEMIEASRLRALALRREAIDALWQAAVAGMRRLAQNSSAATSTCAGPALPIRKKA
ncbi:MAG: hypothetical protein JWQ33_2387 [Ramlibacter sp.]|nr:hypothetical protein [Ramlibacter sp.]